MRRTGFHLLFRPALWAAFTRPAAFPTKFLLAFGAAVDLEIVA